MTKKMDGINILKVLQTALLGLPPVPILSGPSRFQGKCPASVLNQVGPAKCPYVQICKWVELFKATNGPNLQKCIKLN